MGKFAKFLYFNIAVYIIYAVIDAIFTFFHFYSNDKLGQDMFIMPNNSDMMFIMLNVMMSTIGGYFVLKKLNDYDNY